VAYKLEWIWGGSDFQCTRPFQEIKDIRLITKQERFGVCQRNLAASIHRGIFTQQKRASEHLPHLRIALDSENDPINLNDRAIATVTAKPS
jgi:hypothetical protein